MKRFSLMLAIASLVSTAGCGCCGIFKRPAPLPPPVCDTCAPACDTCAPACDTCGPGVPTYQGPPMQGVPVEGYPYQG